MDLAVTIGIILIIVYCITWLIDRLSKGRKPAADPILMAGVGSYQAAKLRELRERFDGAVFTGTRVHFGCGHVQAIAAERDGYRIRVVHPFDAQRYNCHTCLLKDGVEVIRHAADTTSRQDPGHTTQHGNVIDLDAHR